MSSKVKSPKSRGYGKTSIVESKKKPQNYFKVLPEVICEHLLKSKNVGEMEQLLIAELKMDSPEIDLKSALMVDIYLTVVIWIRESFQLDTVKFSLIFSGIYFLIENIKTKQTLLKENFEEMKKMLLRRAEMSENDFEGLLGNLDPTELRLFHDFLYTGLLQHYKLFEYVFSYHRAQEVRGTDLSIETLPPYDTTPYPAPLCEALNCDLYNECFAADGSVRSHSIMSTTFNDEELDKDLNKLDQEMDLTEFPEFYKLSIDIIKTVLREECDNVFRPASAEMSYKIEEIEQSFMKKINKSPKT